MITTKVSIAALVCATLFATGTFASGGAEIIEMRDQREGDRRGLHRGASLQNADFESGKSYWILAKRNGGRARYMCDTLQPISGGGSALVYVQQDTGQHDNVQLFQPYPLQSLTEYNIQFKAQVADTTAIVVAFVDDEKDIWSTGVTLFPGQDSYGPYRYFSDSYAPFALFAFHLGQASSPVRLDAVAVTANSSALAYKKRASQQGLNVKTLLPGLLHVEIPFPHHREVPLVLTDHLGRLLTSEVIAPGTTGKQIRVPALSDPTSAGGVVLNLFVGERVLSSQLLGSEVWSGSSKR